MTANQHAPVTPAEVVDAAGGASQVAAALGIGRGTVYAWTRLWPSQRKRRRENAIPADRVLDMERLSGYSRHQIRPDIFGAAPEVPRPKAPKESAA